MKLRRTYWLAVALLVALVLVYVHQRDFSSLRLDHRESRNMVDGLRLQVETLQEEEDRLRRRVEHLGTDPVEMEAAIRENKNLVRRGETIYRVEFEAE
jgi:cell division protein FtsB